MWVLRAILLLLLATAPAAKGGHPGPAAEDGSLAELFEEIFERGRDRMPRAPEARDFEEEPKARPDSEAGPQSPQLAAPRAPVPWKPWLLPAALLASAALVGALAAAVTRRGRGSRPRGRDREAVEAGQALAARQADALGVMEGLGLGRPEVLENGPRGGTVVIRGKAPRGGCGFREGYLRAALKAEVREVAHGRERCEFEIRR